MPLKRPAPSLEGQLPPPPEPSFLSYAVSFLSHAVVILLALLFVRGRTDEAKKPERTEPDTARQVTMLYVPPPPVPQPLPPIPKPLPQPAPQPATPPPPVAPPKAETPKPEPEPNAPADAQRRAGPESETPPKPDAPPTKEPQGQPDASADAAPLALAATMESEAKRIFGNRRGREASGDAGPVAVRPFENASIPESKCPQISRDSTGAFEQGIVQGIVRNQEDGRPIPFANLQMVGQPYNTFANERGEFRLTFDGALMADCRVQYVTITAPGYRSQMLPLMLGGGVSTVGLKRR